MLTLPNIITLLRLPLAFAFLQENTLVRGTALFLAMLSDGLDGYFARRYGKISRVGTFLDPVVDKFFVFFILAIMLSEHRLEWWEAATMLSRDFSILLFGIYLAIKGNLGKYQYRAIWCGKIMTSLQFVVLIGLVFNVIFPPSIYFLFVVIGVAALGELYLERKKITVES